MWFEWENTPDFQARFAQQNLTSLTLGYRWDYLATGFDGGIIVARKGPEPGRCGCGLASDALELERLVDASLLCPYECSRLALGGAMLVKFAR